MGWKMSCLGNYREVRCENPPTVLLAGLFQATEQKEEFSCTFSCTALKINGKKKKKKERKEKKKQKNLTISAAFIRNTVFLISFAQLIFHRAYLEFSRLEEPGRGCSRVLLYLIFTTVLVQISRHQCQAANTNTSLTEAALHKLSLSLTLSAL